MVTYSFAEGWLFFFHTASSVFDGGGCLLLKKNYQNVPFI
jgi:hypothetical protein